MQIKINPVVRPFFFILLIVSVNINYAKSPQFQFKQVMPRSEWMEYRPDEPHRAVILDGEGGAIVASVALGPVWLLVQKIDRFGNVLWANPGQARLVALNMPGEDDNYAPIMVSDGNGGVFIAYAYANYQFNEVGYWYDYDVYVQHIARDFERRWGERGIAVAASEVTEEYPRSLITDGKGGLFILFHGPLAEHDYGSKYLQHINQNGELLWPTLGKVMLKPDTFGLDRLIPDDDGGAFLFGVMKYAQRIDPEGQLCWSLPYMSTGLPSLWRQWIFRNNEENTIIVAGFTNDFKHFAAQKISEEDGTVLWGTEGKLWTPPNYDKIFDAQITPNGKGGAFIFYKHNLQELDADGNYLYETPVAVLDTVQFQNWITPVCGDYIEGQGAFVLYTNSVDYNHGQVIFQKITPAGNLPWGKSGITICDTTGYLLITHSLFKIDPNFNEAYIFLEFSRGIFVTKVDLATGLPVTTVQNNARQTPAEFRLTAYPNPFTCSTYINITNPTPLNSNLTVKIYDILGREVIDLSHKLNNNQIQWTGLDFQNQIVAPGIYFVRFSLKNQVQIKKIVKIH